MKTITAKDLRRLYAGIDRDDIVITIEDKQYTVGRYISRDDVYELIEQVKDSEK